MKRRTLRHCLALLGHLLAQLVLLAPHGQHKAGKRPVGGQAVMEGVMMRDGVRVGIAVRTPDGVIHAENRAWHALLPAFVAKTPFLRGFPVLLETMVNGVSALNHSARIAMEYEEREEAAKKGNGAEGETPATGADKPTDTIGLALFGTVVVALLLAIGLFVALPHVLSVAMQWLGLSGGVDSLSFHAWDGLFKFVFFVGYVALISLMPDIRRVFEYHGAEHKLIWAYERTGRVDTRTARVMSRLHPRCGTTFMLFVLSISIGLFAVLVPIIMGIWSPTGPVLEQVWAVVVKLGLMIPVSCLAYELIKFSGRHNDAPGMALLAAPGLLLQRLTTYEPDHDQLDVAGSALSGALSGAMADASASAVSAEP